jgi:hypothetical protein
MTDDGGRWWSASTTAYWVHIGYRNLLDSGMAQEWMGDDGPWCPDAIAWYEGVERLAAEDGFPTERSNRNANGEFVMPVVFLLRPDGSRYPWFKNNDWISHWGHRRKIKPLMRKDWGSQLKAARNRHARRPKPDHPRR